MDTILRQSRIKVYVCSSVNFRGLSCEIYLSLITDLSEIHYKQKIWNI